ncbi:hypothetical protein AAHC03_09656 [Spirometra sp. Aus1]
MSEYEKNFNWEETWLNAPPQRQQQKAGTAKAEPHFQHRRRVGPTDTFTLKTHFSQPQDDDYFLLGRRDQKFGSSIVYPLAKPRAKVSDGHPSLEERPDERVAKATVAHKTKPRIQLPNKGLANLEDAGKCKPPVTHISRKSTTEAPTTLPHKVHRSHTRSHSHHKKRPVERWPEIKLDLPLDSTERPTTTGPKAPRGEQNHIDEPVKEDPKRLSMAPQSQQQQQHAPPLISRPRTAPQPAVQTEYQRAYSPPPNYSYTRPGARCTSHTSNLVQHSELTKQTSSTNYSTPLQKPTCAQSPQRRSHSASFIDKHKPNALIPTNEKISTPRQSSKRDFSACNTEPYHASRYLSEYQAKFRNFSDLPLSDERTVNAYSVALGERNVAARRRGATEDSHFSRDHLGQLKSSVLWLWDQQNSTRSINFTPNKRGVDQKLQNYQLPPAGMPSSPNKSSSHRIAVPTRIPPATRETFPLRPHAQHSATRVDPRKAGVGRRRRPLSQKVQNRGLDKRGASASPIRYVNSARYSSPIAEARKLEGWRANGSPLRNIIISSARSPPNCCVSRRYKVLKSRPRPWKPAQTSTFEGSGQKKSCTGLSGIDPINYCSPISDFTTAASLGPKAYDATKYSDWEVPSPRSWTSLSAQKANIGMAERTLERARQRCNQVLISSCRYPHLEKYWLGSREETGPHHLCLT